MSGGKYHLLLLLLQLEGHVLLGGCQSLTVSTFPNFKEIYVGDLFFLRCESQGKGEVKWFYNNKIVPEWKDGNLKIPVAARKHSGTYHCERNGSSSSNIAINVLGHYPTASLILKTGQPVMRVDGSVILRLANDEGLLGWKCYVFKEQRTRLITLKLGKNDRRSIEFQPNKLVDPETIFWCTNRNQTQRSNQVVIRTSDKDVSMEMYFAPVVAGDALNLRCLHWGMEKISSASFYKNDGLLKDGSDLTYRIDSVTESDQGDYKCHATFADKGLQVSDVQQLFVQEEVMRAVVSGIMGLSCSCPDCPRIARYIWYKISDDNRPLELPGNTQGFMNPHESGIYACIVVWDLGRTLISKGYSYNLGGKIALITVSVILILLVVLAAIAYWKQKKRSNTELLYEDMMLKSKVDDRYERLQVRHPQKESEYDTIQPTETHHVKKEGDYQPLAKAGMTEGVYHTLGMEGEESRAAAGGYEALQRKTMKEEIYHSIGMEGAASGEQN